VEDSEEGGLGERVECLSNIAVIITSFAMGLLLFWKKRRPKLIFAVGGTCIGIAFLALFVMAATSA
jgi:hypothetical protein